METTVSASMFAAAARLPQPQKLASRHDKFVALSILLCVVCFGTIAAKAAQFDIAGPPGSGTFGSIIKVLPNGNVVVADPYYSTESNTNVGAVYLYSPSGFLISTLHGSNNDDFIGSEGVVVLSNGSYLIRSHYWNATAGAVTMGDPDAGVSGVVSKDNSLVGAQSGDRVGNGGVTELSNGNFVVISPTWSNDLAGAEGAVTWFASGAHPSGFVSPLNSLTGGGAFDQVGSARVTPLPNGNFVVASPEWNSGRGAVTLRNGSSGQSGVVSQLNSLVGTSINDHVGSGGVVLLANGNYVVLSPGWNGAQVYVGAVTLCNGGAGLVAEVSVANSLTGTTHDDRIGFDGVTPLANGNFVILSTTWNSGQGAATWGDGVLGITGEVSDTNSLVVGSAASVVALSNGNYVVASPSWVDGTSVPGAATWGSGSSGVSGNITSSNSLVGSAPIDEVAAGGIVALSDGNYVVASPNWSGGEGVFAFGAATLGDGNTGTTGAVLPAKSFIGSVDYDYVAESITALHDGRYVIASPEWHNGVVVHAGAVTWADDAVQFSGTVSPANSLVGASTGALVGYPGVSALSNGNYVVDSAHWNNGTDLELGAVTWANGSRITTGVVSPQNSLVGATANDNVGSGGITSLPDGNYVVASPSWSNGPATAAGAITLASGRFRLAGTIQQWNSVRGTPASGGSKMVFGYDPSRRQLAVGRPADNMVTLFTMDQIFADALE